MVKTTKRKRQAGVLSVLDGVHRAWSESCFLLQQALAQCNQPQRVMNARTCIICCMLEPNMSAPPRRCWVGDAASSVCAVGQRTHPAEVQSEPHLPSDVVLGQLRWLLNGLAWRLS